MPIHDWTRVPAGIFHAFHHRWISAVSDALNSGLLPDDYYVLPEQQTAGPEPDVLIVQSREPDTAKADAEFYRRKKSWVAVRHVSDDRVVAIVEIVSPGNKAG